ncbi:MAG TPA: hypothetical protein VK052_14545 [Zeimonas sp.]|nr:hypothetical protein [Zeimonas sp.]
MEQRLGTSSEDVLAWPVSGGRALTTAQRRDVDLSHRIPGWGSDLDPARRPGVPRDKAPEIGRETLYPPIEQQVPEVRIHKSTEHARLTPVFGTACPPSGLSGRLRDFAYRFSEGRLAHWMMLMLADRVDVVEGLADDLARGYVPDFVRETGIATEWRYNRAGLARKALVAGLAVGLLAVYARGQRESRRS